MTTVKLKMYATDKAPGYANESQYLLLVSCGASEEDFDDELLWGLWHEGEWWILNDTLDIPFPDEAFTQDGDVNELVSFVKFSDQTWFTLKGWTSIWGGVGPLKKGGRK